MPGTHKLAADSTPSTHQILGTRERERIYLAATRCASLLFTKLGTESRNGPSSVPGDPASIALQEARLTPAVPGEGEPSSRAFDAILNSVRFDKRLLFWVEQAVALFLSCKTWWCSCANSSYYVCASFHRAQSLSRLVHMSYNCCCDNWDDE